MQARSDQTVGGKGSKQLGMTTDLWTSLTTTLYIAVTGQFVHDWSLQSQILARRPLTDKHTGKHIADLVETIQHEFRTIKYNV